MQGTNVATLLDDMILRRKTKVPTGWGEMRDLNLLVIQPDTGAIKGKGLRVSHRTMNLKILLKKSMNDENGYLKNINVKDMRFKL